ncbi:MAG TPA: biotin transporter BioY [Clostridiaceae bacterium]|nr:biotin transporter BioY [Clostridiaceae bacterium]
MVKKPTVYQITIIGLMAAVLCILGPLAIPVGLVPVSFTNLAIFFTIYILGTKKAVMSLLIYLLIGLAGAPVFSGFSGGASKILGPTGGYIIGFIFMTLISGVFIDRFINRWYICVLGMILGTIVCYAFGTIWLSYQADMVVFAAIGVGVVPFIPGDIIKILFIAITGPKIRKRLIRSNLFIN